jgi:hypothetical protein
LWFEDWLIRELAETGDGWGFGELDRLEVILEVPEIAYHREIESKQREVIERCGRRRAYGLTNEPEEALVFVGAAG